MVRRHATAAAGMVLLGVATGGIGAIASWTYALYGIVEAQLAAKNRVKRFDNLRQKFQMLGDLLTPDEIEEKG